tara:strand:+ start:1307 stop:2344 length:1038 start_codon:yes stop_codon:yes gene_type:complete
MNNVSGQIILKGLSGNCGSKQVLLGFAPAHLLFSLSKSDVLDESTGKGYQRKFNAKHSLDFRKYIQKNNSTTIPLTFNLRPRGDSAWNFSLKKDGTATLKIDSGIKVLHQVDCQHRLGHLSDVDVSLAYMIFIGLTAKEEMEIFNVINAKAKGLSTSLLDYHESKLISNLEKEKPEILLAIKLNDDELSPWFKQLDLGGNKTSGMHRRASLRTMQKAIKRFLKETQISYSLSNDEIYEIILCFWQSVAIVLSKEWEDYRKHHITKGIGVYSLMGIAADIYIESKIENTSLSKNYFSGVLSDYIGNFDWSNNGPLKGLGGEAGVKEALKMLRKLKSKSKLKILKNG